MAVIVRTGQTQVTKIAPGNNTIVKKITVGRPVRRVAQATGSLSGLNDVDATSAVNGSVLVYNSSSEKWVATLDLEEQNINGGSY